MRVVFGNIIFGNLIALTLASLFGGDAAAAELGDAAVVFANSFTAASDVNYDDWPDHWQRETGDNYPHYTRVAIGDDPAADDGRCLQVELDGGGAKIVSQAIPLLPKFGYRLLLRAHVEQLQYARLTVVVELQNRHGDVVQVERSQPLGETKGWIDLEVGPIRPQDPEIDRAVIQFDVPRGERGDLQGRISIDQLVLRRLPSMTVSTGSASNLFDDFNEIEVQCVLSGIRDPNPVVQFRLIDGRGRVMEGKGTELPLEARLIDDDQIRGGDQLGSGQRRAQGYEGTIRWQPPIDDYGFYKVRVEMMKPKETETDPATNDYERQLDPQEITLAVLPKLPHPPEGEFGWSLPSANDPLSFDQLIELLPRVGVHWMKMPVWYAADNTAAGEELVRFAERASAAGIEVVGIIDDPTSANYADRDPQAATDVANLLLADASYWRLQYEHVMTRLSLRLRWWQLGNDLDTSFYGYPGLPQKLLSIRQQLFRFGQDVNLGIGWRWPQDEQRDPWQPPEPQPTWDFEQMSCTPALSAEQLHEQMPAVPRTTAQRWVHVDPAAITSDEPSSAMGDAELHDLRVREFVRQMVAAKIHGADGIFVANPFTGPTGVMQVDGTPGELLLPWRTTSCLLGGTRYMGQLQLPQGSTNHLFECPDGEVVMIVWNEQASQEELYLGECVEQIDVWGRRRSLVKSAEETVTLEVGRQPSFVLGLHPSIARWRMAIAFDQERMPSVFSRPHDNTIRGINSFRQGVSGKYSLFVPAAAVEAGNRWGKNDRWEILPEQGDLTIGGQQSFELPIQISLDEADYGLQPVRIDFDIEADQRYRFSVWRTLHVGLGDIEIHVRTYLDERGQLVVEQQMSNSGPRPVDFKCLLYNSPRRRKRTQVVMLGADGNQKTYYYPQGEELIGSLLKLRAEEMGGNRVLIHRFTAERGE